MADYGDEIETKNESLTEKMKIHDDDSSFSSDLDLDSEKKKKHDEDVKKLHDAPLPSSSMKSKKPVHKLLGGGKPADVFLWRNKKISTSVLGVATASWVLFELLDYHLVTLVCHVLMLVFAILFLWSNASKFINKSPPSIPEVRIPEDTFRRVATALRIEINRFLDIMRDIGSGRELKQFVTVVVGLWVLSILGSWCDFLTLFYITFVLLHTIPVLYEKYEEQVDAFVEKAMIEIKRSYAVFDDKVVSKIPKGPLKGKKRA